LEIVGVPRVAMSRPLDARSQNTLLLSSMLFAGALIFFFTDLYKFYYGALALIVAYLAYVSSPSRTRIALSYPFPILVLCAYWCVSLLWSADAAFGGFQLEVGTAFFLFAWFPTLSRSCTDDFKFRLIQAAAAAYAVAEIVNYAATGTTVNALDIRFRAAVGEAFLTAIPSLVYSYSVRRSTLALLLLIVIGAIALVLGSRSLLVWGPPVFLAAITVAARGSKASLQRLRRRLGIGLLVVPLIAVAAVQIYFSDAYSRIRNETSTRIGREVLMEQFTSQNPEDIERRINTFVSLQMFVDHPMFGAGFGSTAVYVHRVSRFKTVAHGLPLMLLAETGIVGTAIFSAVLLLSLRGYRLRFRGSRDEHERKKVLFEVLTLGAILLAGLTTQVYFNAYLYIFLGTGLYYRQQFRAAAISSLAVPSPRS